MRQVSLLHFIERKLRFKEINLYGVTTLEVTKVGFDFRTLTLRCFCSKYIPFQPAFVIVASSCIFRCLTCLNNSFKILGR